MCVYGFTTDPIFSSDPKDFIGFSLKNKYKVAVTDPNSKFQSPGISNPATIFARCFRYPCIQNSLLNNFDWIISLFLLFASIVWLGNEGPDLAELPRDISNNNH